MAVFASQQWHGVHLCELVHCHMKACSCALPGSRRQRGSQHPGQQMFAASMTLKVADVAARQAVQVTVRKHGGRYLGRRNFKSTDVRQCCIPHVDLPQGGDCTPASSLQHGLQSELLAFWEQSASSQNNTGCSLRMYLAVSANPKQQPYCGMMHFVTGQLETD